MYAFASHSVISLGCALVVSVVLCISANAQEVNDWASFGLKGRVKSILLERSKVVIKNGREVEDRRQPLEQTDFDQCGYYTDRIGLENGNKRQFRNKHDHQCRIVERTELGSDEIRLYRYSPGKIETSTELRGGHLLDRNIYNLDDRGRTLVAEYFLVDEKLGRRLYDPPAKILYKYGDDGNLIERSYLETDGTASSGLFGESKYIFKYTNGRLVEWTAYKTDGSEFGTWIRQYDSQGRIVEVSSNRFGKTTYSEFDAQGNWHKSTRYSRVVNNGKTTEAPIEIDYRQITYYE
jgi:hypothetical protein